MPSLKTARKIKQLNYSPTIGNQIKDMSDFGMQETWYNDVQTKTCYIYDYYHDDQFDETRRSGYDPSLSKSKIKVDLKFIVKEYKSLAKDDPEYHIQFSPNDWNNKFKFDSDRRMSNFEIDNEEQLSLKETIEKNFDKLDIHFPIGLYVDIPDDRGIYWKWMIVYEDVTNQFPKFGLLKCNYLFRWIHDDGLNKYKRCMWGVQRTQSSYNSGVYKYTYTEKLEMQSKFWLPWNYISSEIFYNQRIIVSMPMKTPIVWRITKVENTVPKGVNMFTIYQDEFNAHTDFVCLEDNNPDFKYGEMYADYWTYGNQDPIVQPEESYENNHTLLLECAKATIKVGGSYKTITAKILDEENNDVTNTYDGFINWYWTIDENDTEDLVKIINTEENKNVFKIKLSDKVDESYLNKTLKVKCIANDIEKEIILDIMAL